MTRWSTLPLRPAVLPTLLMILAAAAVGGAAAALLHVQARDFDANVLEDGFGSPTPTFAATRPGLRWLHLGNGQLPETSPVLHALTNPPPTASLRMWTLLP